MIENTLEFYTKEFSKHEKAIDYQMINLGIPSNAELIGRDDVVFVHEYLRGDGTAVKAHYRSRPDGGILSWDSVNFAKVLSVVLNVFIIGILQVILNSML